MLRKFICAVAFAMSLTTFASQLVLNPAPGQVSQLEDIVITFGDAEWEAGNRAAFTLTGPEGVEIPKLKNRSTGSGWRIYFDDDAVLTTPGEYVFTVPAGRFVFVDGDTSVENEEESFVYTIVEGGSTGGEDPEEPEIEPGQIPAYAIDPVPGQYDAIYDGFTIVFEATSVQILNQAGICLAGPDADVPIYAVTEMRQPKMVIAPINVNGDPIALTAPGSYILIIAAEAIAVDDTANADPLVFEYTITESTPSTWDGQYTADPADNATVESLKEINITFEGAALVTLNDNAKPADFPKLINADDEADQVGAMGFVSGNVLNVSLYSEVTKSATYKLVIPEGFFQVDGAALAGGIILNYAINNVEDGIESILGESQTATIYNLAGVKVLEGANAQQANALPSGIYIANGRKFFVK